MRLFVAIPLPEQTTAEIHQIVGRIRLTPGLPNLRWSPPESWHITLQFLGTATPEQYACLADRLRSVHAATVRIAPDEIGAFQSAGVLYAGLKPSPELTALQKRITAATALCGFSAEERPYHPHITLARTRSTGRRELSAIVKVSGGLNRFQALTASEFALYESVPGAPACYVIRERFAFA